MGLALSKGKLPPGLRFHPTDVELVMHYLMRKASGKPLEAGFVAETDIYQFHPADLKAVACFSKELNWYFFCSTGNKYGSGQRKNRSTHCGFWKPTGNDRDVVYQGKTVGKVKTLVFHEGKPAKGERTDWFMYEYRLEDGELGKSVVLCKIFKKGALGPRNGEQFGAVYNEEEWNHAEMNENDLDSADANTNTTEQVHSGVVSQSVIHQASTPTSNGGISDANPFQKNPTAATDIASSSIAPVPDNTDEMFRLADFGEIYMNLGDLPYITLDDLDTPV